MMFKRYEAYDLVGFKANRFSQLCEFGWALEDAGMFRQTLVDERGRTMAIIGFMPYHGDNYIAFFLISEDLKPVHMRLLKRFFLRAIRHMRADRVQTQSLDHPVVNMMHEFFGFTMEGTNKRFLNGQDYKMWSICNGDRGISRSGINQQGLCGK